MHLCKTRPVDAGLDCRPEARVEPCQGHASSRDDGPRQGAAL
jgi:hypothetical protein